MNICVSDHNLYNNVKNVQELNEDTYQNGGKLKNTSCKNREREEERSLLLVITNEVLYEKNENFLDDFD